MKLQQLASIGGSYQQVYPAIDGTSDIFTCSGGAIQRLDQRLEIKWSSKPVGAHWIATIEDLDDDGRHEILTSNGRTVLILSADDGNILWSYDVGPPLSYGTYATMFQCERMIPSVKGKQFTVPCFSHKDVLLFDCSDGAENTKLLHSLWMNDAYHPTPVIGDINGDGNQEIVIARLGGVYVFDPLTGRMLSSTQWKSDEERRRNYGHFELADTDGAGILNAVILSDRVTRHVALLENDGAGNFSPRWDRFIEHIYPNDTTELRYCYGSVSGLESRAIVFSSFNAALPDRWCTEVIDPLTGKDVNIIEDHWLAGVGSNKLLLQHAPARALSEFSAISIADESDNVFADAEDAQFAKRTRHYRGAKGQFKPEVFGQDDVWSVGEQSLIITRSKDGYQLRTFSGSQTSDWFLESDEPFRVAALHEDEPIVCTRSGEVTKLNGASIQLGLHLTTEAHLSARPGTQAFTYGELRIYPTPNNLVRLSGEANSFRVPGRGRLGYDNVYHNTPVFDTPEGRRFAVVDDEDLPHARLTLYELQGTPVGHIDLPELPPSRPGSRIGVYDWQYFVHSRGPALYIAAYRSLSMNSECSLAVLIESGEVLWKTSQTGEGEFGRGIGPWGSSSLTRINGRTCVIFCAKDTLVTLDLEDGSFARTPLLLTDLTMAEMQRQGIFKEQGFDTWSTIDDPFTAYGTPIAQDIDADGRDEYLIAGCFGGFGLLDHNFDVLWWKIAHFGDVLYRMPAIAELDAYGRQEIYQSHSDHSIRAYSLVSGDELGRIPTLGIATDLAVVNDALIATTNFGMAYRIAWREGTLQIVDEVSSNAALGSPVASVDGRVLIASGDGMLFSFEQ